MNGRATVFKQGDKEIYLVDYSGIRNAQLFRDVIRETGKFRDRLIRSDKKDLLLLVDLSGSELNMEIYDRLKKHGLMTKPIIKKEAVVGMKRFSFIVNTFNMSTGMNFKMFDTREDAVNWLLNEQNTASAGQG